MYICIQNILDEYSKKEPTTAPVSYQDNRPMNTNSHQNYSVPASGSSWYYISALCIALCTSNNVSYSRKVSQYIYFALSH